MKCLFFNIWLLLGLLAFTLIPAMAQEDNPWDEFLEVEVDVENPVYKPVIGFGAGMLNFMGDVKNDYTNPLSGQLGYKINIATFVDRQNLLRANFFFITGALSGYARDENNLDQAINFRTDIFNFGINLEYGFRNFYQQERRLYPFVSVGAETFLYSPKADLGYIGEGGELLPYYYWGDGTIRNIPESQRDTRFARIMGRDYIYETDLHEQNIFDKDLPTENYSFAIPVEVGIDFSLSYRVTLRLGTSMHFTFTDFLDGVSGTNNQYQSSYLGSSYHNQNYGGNLFNDMFMFTYATLHLDLFSEDKVITMNRLLAEIETDPTMIGDEDYDMVFDISDDCLGTPFGVAVDSVGCPIDTDKDGVPDYLDQEADTPKGAIVDENGVTMSEQELIALVSNREAVDRDMVDLVVLNYTSRAQYQGVVEVPPKFRDVDSNKDGYISFEEVLSAIDRFFDYDSDLTIDELYELNTFFFSQ